MDKPRLKMMRGDGKYDCRKCYYRGKLRCRLYPDTRTMHCVGSVRKDMREIYFVEVKDGNSAE
jgi:hypothetical protein